MLHLYNSASRQPEPFQPQDPKKVTVYGCGPTIYDFAHIGNFRTFMFYDLVHRYLEVRGFGVEFVVNFTDVDDKTIAGALADGVGLADYTAPFGEAFLRDADALGIRRFDAYPRATEHIEHMVAFVERLVERGLAYQAEDGSVYYRVSAFEDYGKLSGNRPDGSEESRSRIAVDEYSKDDVRDFALWKSAKEEDEQVGAVWESPWGPGRPGWHLECSVMSIHELGNTLDLHLGGEDLLFPHHENEIAQSEGATRESFVRCWLHVKHLQVEGQKMSKSLGNFITVHQLLDEGVEPAAIRHQLLSAHYRSELNFTRDGLTASGKAIQRLLDFKSRVAALGPPAGGAGPLCSIAQQARDSFFEAMDDDLNVPEAMAALFTFVHQVNGALDERGSEVGGEEMQAILDALDTMDGVLGILGLATEGRSLDQDIELWVEGRIQAREDARANRDFAAADAIRDELAAKGIVLEDTAEGTRWKRVHRMADD